MYDKLTEKQLEQLFLGKKTKKPLNPIKWAVFFVLIFLVVLATINFPAYSSNFSFWFNVELKNQSYENPIVDKVASGTKPASTLLPIVSKNTIYIDKLDLHAPINFDVPNETQAVAEGLENGTVHILGTAHPGEIGNVFITGHSSNYVWAAGSYKHVFSRLNKLEDGDNVTINYNNIIYIYQITDKYVVSADATSNLAQRDTSELTLMTCYPVGTNLNRLMIKAIQIKPDPANNQKKAPSNLDNLPNISR